MGHIQPQRRVSNQTAGKRRQLLDLFNNGCFYCGCRLTIELMTIDHLVPKSKGGSSELNNLVPSCAPCNTAKADNPPTANELQRAFNAHGSVPEVNDDDLSGRPYAAHVRRLRQIISTGKL